MSILLIIIHVFVCIALIMIVLLQTGKGADMGAAFGAGSSQTLFGSSGAGTFFGKATTAIAVIFMITSLCLAYLSSNQPKSSIMNDAAAPPMEQTAPANPVKPAPVNAKPNPQGQAK
jgi:preprotein translocase subunit SecG